MSRRTNLLSTAFAGLGLGLRPAAKPAKPAEKTTDQAADDAAADDAAQTDADDAAAKPPKAGKKGKGKGKNDDDNDDAPDDDKSDDDDPEEDEDEGEMAGQGEAGAARLREQARIAVILADPHAKGRADSALHLALNTRLSARDAIALLATMPKGNARSLDALMDQHGHRSPNAGGQAPTPSAQHTSLWSGAFERQAVAVRDCGRALSK